MDVDRPAGQPLAQFGGEHLHVAGQHHQVDVLRLHHLDQTLLGGRLAGRVHRQMDERDAVRLDQVGEVGVVGDDGRDVHVQGADPVPEEQVVQAVPELRDEDEHPVLLGRVDQVPAHVERLGHRGEAVVQALQGLQRVEGTELHPHEEGAGEVGGIVVVLLALQDVAAVLDQEAGHGVDDAGSVGARQGENELPAGGGRGRLSHARSVLVTLHPGQAPLLP